MLNNIRLNMIFEQKTNKGFVLSLEAILLPIVEGKINQKIETILQEALLTSIWSFNNLSLITSKIYSISCSNTKFVLSTSLYKRQKQHN